MSNKKKTKENSEKKDKREPHGARLFLFFPLCCGGGVVHAQRNDNRQQRQQRDGVNVCNDNCNMDVDADSDNDDYRNAASVFALLPPEMHDMVVRWLGTDWRALAMLSLSYRYVRDACLHALAERKRVIKTLARGVWRRRISRLPQDWDHANLNMQNGLVRLGVPRCLHAGLRRAGACVVQLAWEEHKREGSVIGIDYTALIAASLSCLGLYEAYLNCGSVWAHEYLCNEYHKFWRLAEQRWPWMPHFRNPPGGPLRAYVVSRSGEILPFPFAEGRWQFAALAPVWGCDDAAWAHHAAIRENFLADLRHKQDEAGQANAT